MITGQRVWTNNHNIARFLRCFSIVIHFTKKRESLHFVSYINDIKVTGRLECTRCSRYVIRISHLFLFKKTLAQVEKFAQVKLRFVLDENASIK